jgi:hypothetical protein
MATTMCGLSRTTRKKRPKELSPLCARSVFRRSSKALTCCLLIASFTTDL